MKKAQAIEAVVVLSGGQDSATCLALAIAEHGADKVAAITFEYGQRHSIETRFARGLAKRFQIAAHKVVNLAFYRHLTANALMNKDMPIKKEQGAKAPTTLVEGRNPLFSLVAAIWAKSLGAKRLWTGVSQADFSGYPDCREDFIRAHEQMLRLAMEWPFEIVTPFMNLTKKDEWAIADELGIFDIIENDTVTCYRGIPGKGCGKCPACKLRNRGLKEFLATRRKRQNMV